MKQRMVAAVDVGSSKVCSLLANIDAEGSIQIVGFGTTLSRGIVKGQVADIDQASESIHEAVRRAEQTSGENISSVYVGTSGGSNISSLGSRGTVSVGQNARTVAARDVNRAIGCARDLDLPGERRVLHVIPTQYIIDSQIAVKDPRGLHAFRMDVDTHIVTITQSSAENIVKCARKAGLNIEGVVLQCLASAEAVLHLDETDAGVVLADIGAGTTGITAYKNGNVILTAVLPVGGHQITRDLSFGLGIPFEMAEQLKKEYCNLTAKKDGEEPEDAAIKVNSDGIGKIYKQDINDICRPRVEEIMKLILSQLLQQDQEYRGYISEFPAGLVLTGGTANLGGISFVAQEMTGLPARIGVPVGMTGLADHVYKNPAYASSVGVLLCGVKWHPGQEQTWVKGDKLGYKVAERIKTVGQYVPKTVRQHVPWSRG